MIYDSVENLIKHVTEFLSKGEELVPLLKAIQTYTFEEIQKMDFNPLDIRFGEYKTQSSEEIPFEAHRKLWDLQIVMHGEERIGYAPIESLIETVPYDDLEDIAFYSGSGQTLKLSRGMAMLLAPWDAHQPGISLKNTGSNIKKIVVKLHR